jgi:predicted Zn finger-like uncharacterized protein
MYTQCPECLTVYAIDEDALQTSLGIVRCGRCDKRFDALRTLSDTLPIEPLAALPEQEPSERAPTLTEAVPPAAFESAARKGRPKKSGPPPEREAATVPPASPRSAASGDADDWFSDLESELATPQEPANDDASSATDADIGNWSLEFPSESDRTTYAENAAGATSEAAPDESGAPDPALAMGPVVEAPEPFDAADTPAPSEAPEFEEPDTALPMESPDEAATSAVDESATTGVPDEVPIDDRDAEAEPAPAPVYVPPRHRISRASVAWAMGCLLLALLLAAQLAWANRIELFRNPATQPWMARICQTLPCNLPLIKDTSQLELLSRDVRPDPNAADALTITATVRNNAAFSQPWPVVVVELNDLDNKPVAMRRFRPSEYMTDPARRDAGIAPGATAVVAFEVADPGRRAVAFQFGFE